MIQRLENADAERIRRDAEYAERTATIDRSFSRVWRRQVMAAVVFALVLVGLAASRVLGDLPSPGEPLRNHFDLMEIAHVHDENAKVTCRLIIYYNWQPGEGEYRVEHWRPLWKAPRPIPDRGGWLDLYYYWGTFREVRADSFRERWLQYDPEVFDRYDLPERTRRGLAGP